MASENKQQKALEIYRLITGTMDAEGWKYKGDEAELTIESGARGEDIPIDLNIHLDVDRQFVMLLSQMPFLTPEDKRLEMAVAVSAINYRLVDGSFDFDIKSGRMFFRMTVNYRDSRLSRDLVMYLLLVSCRTVDDYNDTLLLLSAGKLSLEDFLQSVNK